MKGKIILKGLQFEVKIGVSEEERAQIQPISIDVVIEIDIQKAIRTQDIHDTVNYSQLQKAIKLCLETKKEYILVETLCHDIVVFILSEFPHIEKIKCTVWKPYALQNAENVGVEIVKQRG